MKQVTLFQLNHYCLYIISVFMCISININALEIEGTNNVCRNECISYNILDGNGGPYSWETKKGEPFFSYGETVTICWNGIDEGQITVTDYSDGTVFKQTVTINANPDTQLVPEDISSNCSSFKDCEGYEGCMLDAGNGLLYLTAKNSCITAFSGYPLQIDFDNYYINTLNLEFEAGILSGPKHGELDIGTSIPPHIIGYTSDIGFCGTDEIEYYIKVGDCYVTATIYIIVECTSLEGDTFIVDCLKVCKNSQESYSAVYTAGNTYEWEVEGAKSFDANEEKLQVIWGNPGQGFIKLKEENINACQDSLAFCVEIIEEIKAAFQTVPNTDNGVLTICEGQTVYFENLSIGADEYFWDFGDGNYSNDFSVSHTYFNTGNYFVQLTTLEECSCKDSTLIEIIVEAPKTPEITCVTTICEGMNSTYYGVADCNTFYWTVSDEGNILEGGNTYDDYIVVEWISGIIGSIELAVEDCNEEYCVLPTTEIVHIIPTENVSIEGPTEICKDSYSNYNIPYFEATEYVWEIIGFGSIIEGQGTENILVQWPTGDLLDDKENKAQVKVTYHNCFLECGGEAVLDVKLKPRFIIAALNKLCEYNILDASAREEYSGPFVNCNWNLTTPDGTVINNFVTNQSKITQTITAGSGTYELEAVPVNPENYCNDSYKRKITVKEKLDAPFSIEGPDQICNGSSYTYNANIKNQLGLITWIVTDGINTFQYSGSTTINHTWGYIPPYKIKIFQKSMSSFYCGSDTLEMDITNFNNIELNGDTNSCVGETILYEATLINSEYYEWTITPKNSGTIISGQGTHQPEIVWHTHGNHNIGLKICGQSFDIAITVYPSPILNVGNLSVCPNEKVMVNAPTGMDMYLWKDENGTELSNNSGIELEGGYYELIVWNQKGCMAKENFYIQTYPLSEVSISTPDFVGFCEGETCNLYALNTEDGYAYVWYKDGLALPGENGPKLTTGDWGKFYVRITDINGCHNQSNIMELFEYCGDNVCEGGNCSGGGGGGPGCPDNLSNNLSEEITYGAYCNEVFFKNVSIDFEIETTIWNFNDPNITDNTGVGDEAQHTYSKAGYYMVGMGCLVEYNNLLCYVEDTALVTIPIAPEFDADTVCIGEAMSFLDKSTFITGEKIVGWYWNFGEPSSGADNTSSATNPTHTYSSSGNFLVSLTITSEYGCDAYIEKQVYVQPPPDFDFISEDEICEGTAMEFKANVSEAISIIWDFGDIESGNANVAQTTIAYHSYETEGIYDVSLTITDIHGCENTIIKSIDVISNNLVLGDISLSQPSPICIGDSVILTAPVGGVKYQWSNEMNTQSISVKQEGIYKVTVTDNNACNFVTNEVFIKFTPAPIVSLKLHTYENGFYSTYNDYYEGCYGTDISISATYKSYYDYKWSFDENVNNYYLSWFGDYLDVGTYQFEVTVTDSQTGCQSVSTPLTVLIHPNPNVFIIATNLSGPFCEGDLIELYIENPDPDMTYYWSNNTEGISTTVFEAGKYYAIAVNEYGCDLESFNTVKVNPSPDISLIPSGCYQRCLPDTICLPAIPDIVSYQWYKDGQPVPAPEGTVADFIIEDEGVYYVELTNIYGCSATSGDLSIEEKVKEIKSGDPILVEGHVFLDANENSIYDNGEDLMAGITIQVTNEGALIEEMQTDINGNFSFTIPIDSVEFCVIMPENFLSQNYYVTTDAIYCFKQELGVIEGACDNTYFQQGNTFIFGVNINCISIINYEENICENETWEHPETGTLYPSGNYYNEYTNTQTNCLVQEYIQINPLPTHFNNENISLCSNETIIVEDMELQPGDIKTFNLFNQFLCDSIVVLTITELQDYNKEINLQACSGTEAIFDGQSLAIGSSQDFIYKNINNCDSIITVIVDEVEGYLETINLAACLGQNIVFDGINIPVGTSKDFTYVTEFGCDSIITVIVDELTTYYQTINLTVCTGTDALFDNQVLPIGTVQDFIYDSTAGCDSIITVEVKEIFAYTETINLQACTGTDAEFDGNFIPAGTSDVFNYTGANGCDSILTIVVEEVASYQESLDLETCTGTNVVFEGETLAIGTIQDFEYKNAAGCDSIITVEVKEIFAYKETINLQACTGTDAEFDGNFIPAGTSDVFNYTGANGCDSILTIVVEEVASYQESLDLETCTGTNVVFEGETLAIGTIQDFEYKNAAGCDSIITVEVKEIFTYTETINLQACTGTDAEFDGNFIPAGTSDVFNYTGANGCDSILTIVVEEVASYQESLDLEACTGTNVVFEGETLAIGTIQDFEYKNAAGCDSIITVEVKEIFTYTETINLQACTGTDAEFDGNFIPAGTSDVFNYTGANGCDSILTVIVDEATVYNETMDIEVCDGQTTTFDNTEMGDGETQAFTYSSEAGCDSVITVNVQAMPVLEPIISTSKSCLNIANGIISIDNVSGGQAPYQYSIDGTNFQTQSTFENIAPGTYTLYVQDDMVCLAEAEITVGAIDAMDISEQELTMECGQDLLTLNALVNNLNDLSTLTFEWHDGTNSESTDIHAPGDYWVDISNECETIRQNFRVTEEAVGSGEPFMIPTAFTPNSDGINDTYCPLPRYKNMEVLSFDFQVYDRWGTRVFQSNSVNDCWDGLREGVDSELGVFVWFYTADVRICGEDRSVFEKGNVTLIY